MSDKHAPAAKRQAPAAQTKATEAHNEQTNLSFRYGTIGIEAVAAAVHCAGFGKKPAATPAAPRIEQRFVESAL